MPTHPDSFRLFIKPWCPWCIEVVEWLDGRGISYERLDVTGDPAAMKEMVRLTGQSRAPSAEIDGAILADFGVDELKEFLQSNGYA